MGILYSNLVKSHVEMTKILHDSKDPFIAKLLDVAAKALVSPYYQKIHLGVLRNDYMLDKNTNSL